MQSNWKTLLHTWTKVINIGPFFLNENCTSKTFITWSHHPFQLVFGLAYIYIFIQLYHIHKLWREFNKNKLWGCYGGQNWLTRRSFNSQSGQFNFPGWVWITETNCGQDCDSAHIFAMQIWSQNLPKFSYLELHPFGMSHKMAGRFLEMKRYSFHLE